MVHTKVKIISDITYEKLEEKINDFIKDHSVKNIIPLNGESHIGPTTLAVIIHYSEGNY